MSIRTKAVTAGALGLVLALAVIAGSALFLPSANHTSTSATVVTQSSESSQTTQSSPTQAQSSESSQSSQSAQSSESSQTSQSSQASQTSSGGADQAGTVDVLLTDPPTLPTGVTAVYVTYSNVAVHVSGAGNQSGWTNSNTTGTINIVSLVNVSSTIATIKVTQGDYNALRFNISSALVTYNSKNYTAFVQGALLTVPIPGGIPVNATTSSAAIIDMHPTVVNIGSDSTPEFIISTAATGYCIPQHDVTSNMGNHGQRIDLVTSGWWQQISENATANVSITNTTLTSDSFTITVTNTGSTAMNLSALYIAPLGNECAGANSTTSTTTSTSSSTNHKGSHQGNYSLPDCLTGSASFIVLDNGTIVPISAALPLQGHGGGQSQVSWGLFGETGYQLAAGKSVTFTYNGSITFGLGFSMNASIPGVISGDQYEITVIGQQALGATVVVAS